MFLIDRVLAAAHAVRRRRQFTPEESRIYGFLADAAVFEITNVVPLAGDWERERSRPLPRRAPDAATWCEWEQPGVGGRLRRVGTLVVEAPITNPAVLEVWTARAHDVLAAIGVGDVVYTLDVFREDHDGSPWVIVPTVLAHFRGTGELVEAVCLTPCPPTARHYDVVVTHVDTFGRPFDLPVAGSDSPAAGSDTPAAIGPLSDVWPPFMAFTMLHTKNVSTATHVPDPAFQRKVRKSGNPERVSWKTLVLKLPELAAPRGPRPAPDPDLVGSVGLHKCRGHFKHLVHPKWKEPGWYWWPEHWRGNADRGLVLKDYTLEPADDPPVPSPPESEAPGA